MRILKVGLVAALALGGLALCTNVGFAQDTKEGRKGPGQFTPAQMVERLDKEVKLTAEQKPKVTAFYEEQAKKMREMRADTSLSQEDRREKFRTMREESQKKLKAILTPDQWQKWEKYTADQKGKMGERKKKKES